MIYSKTNISVILVVAVFFLGGCSLIRSKKVVIDKQFLYDIEKAFQEEARTGIDKSQIYNEIWDDNYCELIYLVQKGDLKAIDVSISLIGQMGAPVCLFEGIELLAVPTYEGDQNYFWIALAKKPIDTQLKVICICDRYDPVDWCPQECYFDKNPENKKLYEAKYGLTQSEITNIADRKIKAQNIKLNEMEIYYDVNNVRWKETLSEIKKDNPDFAERFKELDGRDYQAVVYSPIDTQVIGGVFWVFIDRETGKVITWFGEK